MVDTKECNHFWKWFVWFGHHFAQAMEDWETPDIGFYVDEICLHLFSVSPNLYFDFHPAQEGRPARLVISAQSDPNYFSAARRLVESSPRLPDMEIYALRQPGDLDDCFERRYPDFPFTMQDLYFSYYINPAHPHKMDFLAVLLPQFKLDQYEQYLEPVRLLLENMIGEEAVGEVAGPVYLAALDQSLVKKRIALPLAALPGIVNNMRSRYHVTKDGDLSPFTQH